MSSSVMGGDIQSLMSMGPSSIFSVDHGVADPVKGALKEGSAEAAVVQSKGGQKQLLATGITVAPYQLKLVNPSKKNCLNTCWPANKRKKKEKKEEIASFNNDMQLCTFPPVFGHRPVKILKD